MSKSKYPLTKTYLSGKFLTRYLWDGYPNQPLLVPTVSKTRVDMTKTSYVTLGVGPSRWRLKRALGRMATSFLEGRKYRLSYVTVNSQTVIGSGAFMRLILKKGGWVSPYWVDQPGIPVPSQQLENQAVSALVGSFRKGTRSWQGGAFIAELGDLRRLFSSTLASMLENCVSLGHYLKRLLRNGAGRRAVAEAWLQWAFAIRPLADDVATSLATYNGLALREFKPLLRIIGTARGHATGTVTKRNLPGVSASQFTVEETYDSLRYIGYSRPSARTAFLDQFGVGPSDVLPALWEGLPWSFLVDYFSNAQEVIDTTALWWADMVDIEKGVKRDTIVRATSCFSNEPASTTVSGGSWTTQCRRVHRFQSGLPGVSIDLEMPGGTQALNVAALVAANPTSVERGNSAGPYRPQGGS